MSGFWGLSSKWTDLFRGDSSQWRSLIAFSFGLVHGLGFADALREFGIDSGRFGIIVPLVGFNLGVEVGQLCVAAIVLPILWNLISRCRLRRQLLDGRTNDAKITQIPTTTFS